MSDTQNDLSDYAVDIVLSETIYTPHGYAYRVTPTDCGVEVRYREVDSNEWTTHMSTTGGADLAMVLASMIRVSLTTDAADLVRAAVAGLFAPVADDGSGRAEVGDGELYLWHLSHDRDVDDDTYDSCVVVAATWDDARRIHPSGRAVWVGGLGGRYVCTDGASDYEDDAWVEPVEVTAKMLGKATDLEAGTVVCASFNAG